MLNSFSILMPNSVAPSLHAKCDKPSGLGFNFMEHFKNLSLENIVEEVNGVIYTEEWKPIRGYENMYHVSSFGRIKRVNKKFVNYVRKIEGIIIEEIKMQRFPKNGYLLVSLWEDNKEKKKLVHRLVAQHFIENPQNKKTVNHKLGIKTDNRFMMLEWATQSENSKHSYDYLNRKCNPQRGAANGMAKRVRQLSLSNVIINEFETVTEAAKYIGATVSHIARVCRGELPTAKKYKWEYV